VYTFSTFGVITEEELDSSEPVTFNPVFFGAIGGDFGRNTLGAGGAGGGADGPNCVIGGEKY